MNRLFTIANELGNIARRRFELKQQLETINGNIRTVEAGMIPAGGWPGKNADERKAAELLAKSEDHGLRMFAMDKAGVEELLGLLEVDRECLLAEKSAWEWTIRDNEVSCTGLRSAFVEYDVWLKGKAALEAAKVETPASIATLDERARDDAAAYIRLNEITDLDAACMWELPEHLITGSAMDARARNQELQELQDAYEQKYHL